jgi:hypothetical protein
VAPDQLSQGNESAWDRDADASSSNVINVSHLKDSSLDRGRRMRLCEVQKEQQSTEPNR